MKRILSTLALIVGLGSVVAVAQQNLFPFWPIIGSSSYCASTTNSVCTSTIPAGPALTGNETIPVNTNATNFGPSNAYLTLKQLGALPIQVVVVTTPPAGISASNISGGVLYTSTTTITSAQVTLPASPIDQQRYAISANRTITTLIVTAGGSASMGANTTPTVLTASTSAPQGYRFYFNSTDTSWYRLQ